MDKEIVFNRLTSDDVINQVYENSVNFIIDYMTRNNLKSMVLGLSGGLDSTVAASICHEVSKRSKIKLIGRSLPIMNKFNEIKITYKCASFCDDFKKVYLKQVYENIIESFESEEGILGNKLANGNVQARFRMLYLYHLAQLNNGIVIDTDNLSERFTGFFTLHGDVGILSPFSQLWKTEVYTLADFIMRRHAELMEFDMASALQHAIKITPTDGLGISDSDCDQFGVRDYNDLDKILIMYLNGVPIEEIKNQDDLLGYEDEIDNVIKRYHATQFKRNKLPIDAELGLEKNYNVII